MDRRQLTLPERVSVHAVSELSPDGEYAAVWLKKTLFMVNMRDPTKCVQYWLRCTTRIRWSHHGHTAFFGDHNALYYWNPTGDIHLLYLATDPIQQIIPLEMGCVLQYADRTECLLDMPPRLAPSPIPSHQVVEQLCEQLSAGAVPPGTYLTWDPAARRVAMRGVRGLRIQTMHPSTIPQAIDGWTAHAGTVLMDLRVRTLSNWLNGRIVVWAAPLDAANEDNGSSALIMLSASGETLWTRDTSKSPGWISSLQLLRRSPWTGSVGAVVGSDERGALFLLCDAHGQSPSAQAGPL